MYSPQEISGRVEIQDRISPYCHALDAADYDQLDEVFLPDAVRAQGCRRPRLGWRRANGQTDALP
ncbi:nuclear transport factor 2 family protein [Streptomyces sp. NPDC056656]|uniref:nuclear transport factor 2 family protein n=1 Tax=Streptomyces sp. NPDC056656 TaxID=3345895 RepID=UPI0036977F1A